VLLSSSKEFDVIRALDGMLDKIWLMVEPYMGRLIADSLIPSYHDSIGFYASCLLAGYFVLRKDLESGSSYSQSFCRHMRPADHSWFCRAWIRVVAFISQTNFQTSNV
jgi:hypothetical protein